MLQKLFKGGNYMRKYGISKYVLCSGFGTCMYLCNKKYHWPSTLYVYFLLSMYFILLWTILHVFTIYLAHFTETHSKFLKYVLICNKSSIHWSLPASRNSKDRWVPILLTYVDKLYSSHIIIYLFTVKQKSKCLTSDAFA